MPPRFGASSALAGGTSASAAKSAAAAYDGRYEIATPRLPCRSAPCPRRDRNLSDVVSISRLPGARAKAEYAGSGGSTGCPRLMLSGRTAALWGRNPISLTGRVSADCVEKLREPFWSVIFESSIRRQRNDDSREKGKATFRCAKIVLK